MEEWMQTMNVPITTKVPEILKDDMGQCLERSEGVDS